MPSAVQFEMDELKLVLAKTLNVNTPFAANFNKKLPGFGSEIPSTGGVTVIRP